VASSVVALETDWVRLNREVVDVRERFQSLQDKEFKASMVESAAATGSGRQSSGASRLDLLRRFCFSHEALGGHGMRGEEVSRQHVPGDADCVCSAMPRNGLAFPQTRRI